MQRIMQVASAHVDNSISALENQIAELDSAQAGDTKSSAGDKFETSREMLQQQRDQLQAQLVVQQQHKLKLELAARTAKGDTIRLGSEILLADGRRFLIASGLGKVTFPAGAPFWVISPDSPLGHLLLGKGPGAQVEVGNRTIEVLEVY